MIHKSSTIMKKVILSILLAHIIISISVAQISQGGLPYSWQQTLQKGLPDAILLPAVQIPKIENRDFTKHGTFAFAETIEFNKSIDKAGEWIQLDNGDRLWRIRLKSEGAYSINFTFSKYLIPEGAEVFVYSPDKTYKIGAFTDKNNKEYGSLAIAPIPGDEIVIEYYEPEDVDFNGELTIGTIGHDYLNIFGKKDGQYGASGECNIDVNCPEGANWQVQKKSVCRMIINNSLLCSGSLVNNTSQNKAPYVLSANHCVNNQTKAENTVFVFNYESPTCDGPDGSVDQSISGADLVATKNNNQGYLDFTLLKLSTDIPLNYKPFFAGWDSRGTTPEKETCIHHPWGDVKKISHDFDPADVVSYVGWGYDPNSFWRINYWDNGTTEGGSSGSPLFDQNKRIIGTLTGGEASCSVDSCDFFQMFSVTYDKYADYDLQLKHWLDPLNSGVAFLDGMDTESGDTEVADLINVAHWVAGQNLAFYLANDGGYLAGNNIYQDKAKAEFYNKTEFGNRNAVTGAYVAFGYATGRDNTMIELQVLKDNMGSPSTLLGSAKATLKEIKEKADKDYVYCSFDPPIEINGSIYLSVVLPQYEGDTVALMTVEEAEVNTAWEFNYDEEWWPYSHPDNSWGIKLSHIIALEIGRFTAINETPDFADNIKLYPNPATNEININLGSEHNKKVDIEIYEVFGRLVSQNIYPDKNSDINIDISGLQAGFYLVAINIDGKTITKKFVKK